MPTTTEQEYVDRTQLPPPLDHRHYWKPIGVKGKRWHLGHALGRCISHGCSAWTVLGYQERVPYGPCKHCVGPGTSDVVLVDLTACATCGRPFAAGEETCDFCAVMANAD